MQLTQSVETEDDFSFGHSFEYKNGEVESTLITFQVQGNSFVLHVRPALRQYVAAELRTSALALDSNGRR